MSTKAKASALPLVVHSLVAVIPKESLFRWSSFIVNIGFFNGMIRTCGRLTCAAFVLN